MVTICAKVNPCPTRYLLPHIQPYTFNPFEVITKGITTVTAFYLGPCAQNIPPSSKPLLVIFCNKGPKRCFYWEVPNVPKTLVMDQSMWLLHKMHLALMGDLAST